MSEFLVQEKGVTEEEINCTDSKEAETGARRDNNEHNHLLHSVYVEIPPNHPEDIEMHERWDRALSPLDGVRRLKLRFPKTVLQLLDPLAYSVFTLRCLIDISNLK